MFVTLVFRCPGLAAPFSRAGELVRIFYKTVANRDFAHQALQKVLKAGFAPARIGSIMTTDTVSAKETLYAILAISVIVEKLVQIGQSSDIKPNIANLITLYNENSTQGTWK